MVQKSLLIAYDVRWVGEWPAAKINSNPKKLQLGRDPGRGCNIQKKINSFLRHDGVAHSGGRHGVRTNRTVHHKKTTFQTASAHYHNLTQQNGHTHNFANPSSQNQNTYNSHTHIYASLSLSVYNYTIYACVYIYGITTNVSVIIYIYMYIYIYMHIC